MLGFVVVVIFQRVTRVVSANEVQTPSLLLESHHNSPNTHTHPIAIARSDAGRLGPQNAIRAGNISSKHGSKVGPTMAARIPTTSVTQSIRICACVCVQSQCEVGIFLGGGREAEGACACVCV